MSESRHNTIATPNKRLVKRLVASGTSQSKMTKSALTHNLPSQRVQSPATLAPDSTPIKLQKPSDSASKAIEDEQCYTVDGGHKTALEATFGNERASQAILSRSNASALSKNRRTSVSKAQVMTSQASSSSLKKKPIEVMSETQPVRRHQAMTQPASGHQLPHQQHVQQKLKELMRRQQKQSKNQMAQAGGFENGGVEEAKETVKNLSQQRSMSTLSSAEGNLQQVKKERQMVQKSKSSALKAIVASGSSSVENPRVRLPSKKMQSREDTRSLESFQRGPLANTEKTFSSASKVIAQEGFLKMEPKAKQTRLLESAKTKPSDQEKVRQNAAYIQIRENSSVGEGPPPTSSEDKRVSPLAKLQKHFSAKRKSSQKEFGNNAEQAKGNHQSSPPVQQQQMFPFKNLSKSKLVQSSTQAQLTTMQASRSSLIPKTSATVLNLTRASNSPENGLIRQNLQEQSPLTTLDKKTSKRQRHNQDPKATNAALISQDKSAIPCNDQSRERRIKSSQRDGDLSYVDEGFKHLVDFYQAEEASRCSAQNDTIQSSHLQAISPSKTMFLQRNQQQMAQDAALRKSLQALPPLSKGGSNGGKPPISLANTFQGLNQTPAKSPMKHHIPNKLSTSNNFDVLRSSKETSFDTSVKDTGTPSKQLLTSAMFDFQHQKSNQTESQHLLQGQQLGLNMSSGSLSRLSSAQNKSSAKVKQPAGASVERPRALSRGSSKNNRRIIDCSPEPMNIQNSRTIDRRMQSSPVVISATTNEDEATSPRSTARKQQELRQRNSNKIDASYFTQTPVSILDQRGKPGTSDRMLQQLAVFENKKVGQEERQAAFKNCLLTVADMQINSSCQSVLVSLAQTLPQVLESDQSKRVKQLEIEVADLKQQVKTLLAASDVSPTSKHENRMYKQHTCNLTEPQLDLNVLTSSNASTDKKGRMEQHAPTTTANNTQVASDQAQMGFHEFIKRFDSQSASQSGQTNRRQNQTHGSLRDSAAVSKAANNSPGQELLASGPRNRQGAQVRQIPSLKLNLLSSGNAQTSTQSMTLMKQLPQVLGKEGQQKSAVQKASDSKATVTRTHQKGKQGAESTLSKKLKLTNVTPTRDFQDEFMGKYDEFSQSWRDQIDRQRRF